MKQVLVPHLNLRSVLPFLAHKLRSLTHRPGIATSTWAAVLEEAKRSNYQPNTATRTMAYQRHGKAAGPDTTYASPGKITSATARPTPGIR